MEHALVGLESGALLMLGGFEIGGDHIRDIWLLKEGSWSLIGSLPEVRFENKKKIF